MKLFSSLAIAISMYSRIPMPQIEWSEDKQKNALCFFPMIGIILGAGYILILLIARQLGFSLVFSAALLSLLPIILTGGIHFDGFCDAVDAISSRASMERKLEIMKDPRAGAFAVIFAVAYVLITFATWYEVLACTQSYYLVALLPVLSRALTALIASSLKNARGNGMLFGLCDKKSSKVIRRVSVVWILAAAFAMIGLDYRFALVILAVAIAVCLLFIRMAKHQFGGITGDLAGFLLQNIELWCLMAVAFGAKLFIEGAL